MFFPPSESGPLCSPILLVEPYVTQGFAGKSCAAKITIGRTLSGAFVRLGRRGAPLRLLCGLPSSTRCEVRWHRQPIRALREEYARQLVYLGHAAAVEDDLTAAQNLRSVAGSPAQLRRPTRPPGPINLNPGSRGIALGG
jgi:hypothetical protein